MSNSDKGKLVYIDCCMRGESRTKRIATPLIEELSRKYDIDVISLEGSTYPCVDSRILEERNNGVVPKEYVETASRIASAERIVIAAPFWDMSFPSILKVFLENMSLFGVTFDSNTTECYGLCRCKKLLYITTRGMDISTGDPLEQATPYLKALSFLWGLGDIITISAQNMDYISPEEVECRIADAIQEGLEVIRGEF